MSIKTVITTEFQNHGLKAAQRGLAALTKSTLGVSLSLAGLTAGFVALGKAGVKAANDDAQAMQRLASVMGSMGFGDQVGQVEKFISSIEYTTGVMDDELRPAYQSFLQITKDAAAAQALLTTSMDVAAGTGQDLGTVSAKLTKILSGQRKGITQLGLGITALEAKTIDLNDVIAIANERFGGMAEAVAATPAGQLERINTAFANLNETVGYGFMSGLDMSVEKTNRLIQVTNDWAAALGRVFGWASRAIVGVANAIDWVLVKFGLLKEEANATASFMMTWNTQLEKMIEKRIAEIKLQKVLKAISDAQLKAERERVRKAAEAAALKAKEAAAAKTLAELQKKFDMERVSIYAASQKQITAEDRARLTAMMTLNDVAYSDELTYLERLLQSIDKLNALQDEAAKRANATATAAKSVNDASLTAIIDATKILSDTNMTATDKASALAKLLASLDSMTLAAVAGQFGTLGVQILANSGTVEGLTRLLSSLDNMTLNKITAAVIGVETAEMQANGAITGTTAAIIAQAQAAAQAAGALAAYAAAAAAVAGAGAGGGTAGGGTIASGSNAGSGGTLATIPDTGNTFADPGITKDPYNVPSSADFRKGESATNVTVNVSGSVIAQQDLVAAVGDAVNQFARVGGKLVPLG